MNKTMCGKKIFALSCSGLGLMAFSQILIAGMALAVRVEEARHVKIIEKEVEKRVPIKIYVPSQAEPQAEPREVPQLPILPKPEKLATPVVADPRSELLVTQARKARVAGDMGAAIVKLEEAIKASPNDPTVLYELGMVHELMGVYPTAMDYYEKVFQLGVSGAGNLYSAAATKLRDGFEQETEMLGKLSLGRVRIFNNLQAPGGQRVILTIPVHKAPEEEIEDSQIEVAVTFFNKTSKGEIIQLQNEEWAQSSWATLPFDWARGEESLRMDYQIPKRDSQTDHLFGLTTYYGQVVTLSYNGEVIDLQAWPRDLAARISQAAPQSYQTDAFPEFLQQDVLPPNFDPAIPLLNPLPNE